MVRTRNGRLRWTRDRDIAGLPVPSLTNSAAAPAPVSLSQSAAMTRVPSGAPATASSAAWRPPNLLDHLRRRRKTETGEQYRGVAPFKERQTSADQHDPIDRVRGRGERLEPGGDGHRDDVFVGAGHTRTGDTGPRRQVGANRARSFENLQTGVGDWYATKRGRGE